MRNRVIEREKAKNRGSKNEKSICWLILQLPAMAGAWQESGTPFRSPSEWQGLKYFDHHPLLSQAHQQKAEFAVEQSGLGLVF